MVTNGRFDEMKQELRLQIERMAADLEHKRSLILKCGIDITELHTTVTLLREQIAQFKVNEAWMRERINALEIEKGTFVQRVLNPEARVLVAVPELQQSASRVIDPTGTKESTLELAADDPRRLYGDALFEDCGDEHAETLGYERLDREVASV